MSQGRAGVSGIRGRRQGPVLRGVVVVAWLLAAASVTVEGWEVAGQAAIGLIIATPLLRVVWLVYRWAQEKDARFVLTGLLLLAVVAVGAIVAAA